MCVLNLPSLTTIRLDITSGKLTPNATNVKAITVSGKFTVKPAIIKCNYT